MHDCGSVKCEVIFVGVSEGGGSSYTACGMKND